MKIFNTFLIVMLVSFGFTQKPMKDFDLKKSLKQDGFQYQFTVMDIDHHDLWYFRKSKFYFWYKAQKVLSTQGGASGQLLNGEFEAFHDNKQLAQKGNFHKGLKDGKWIYWRTDGSIIKIEFWNKGKYVGIHEFFNENGELIETDKYTRFKHVRTVGDSVIVTKNKKIRPEHCKDDAQVHKDSGNKKKRDSEATKKKRLSWNFFKKGESSVYSRNPKKEKVKKETKSSN